MNMHLRADTAPALIRRGYAFALMCALAFAVAALSGCSDKTYVQTIRVTAETMNDNGLFARVEYLKDGKVVNSVHLVDGDGDGVIDGKAGPKSAGNWPVGWQWFDNMYEDAIVGQTVISFDSQKVVVESAQKYEFIVGEYQVRAAA
jgi:hypothetical protein